MADSDDSLGVEELAFFAALNELGVRYLIVGMSGALLQGATLSTEDIDVWFERLGDERIGEAARRCGGAWITRMQPPRFAGAMGERLDVVTSMSGLPSFDDEYSNAIDVDLGGVVVKVLPLERIIASKRAADRPKDRAALYLLEATLAVLRKR